MGNCRLGVKLTRSVFVSWFLFPRQYLTGFEVNSVWYIYIYIYIYKYYMYISPHHLIHVCDA